MNELYSLENAQKFKWSSVTGNLNPERVSHLKTYLVGQKILDVGCGGGAYVEFLAQQGLEVTGVDKYNQFLQIAHEKSRMGIYVQGDITKLPFPDKTFDCTYCFDVLEHVDDQLAIEELARVTTKRLILAVPQEDEIMTQFNLTFLHYQDKTHLRNYTDENFRNLILKINCSNILIFPELAVPTKYLVQNIVECRNSDSFVKAFFHKTSYFLLKKLLSTVAYKQVNTGLVAVIDL